MDEDFVLGVLNGVDDEYYERCSIDELKRNQDKAIKEEDYMLAARLREFLKLRDRQGEA